MVTSEEEEDQTSGEENQTLEGHNSDEISESLLTFDSNL